MLRLARRSRALIESFTREPLPSVGAADVSVEHAFYGGAYGRALPGEFDEGALSASGIRLDDTYSRKAFAAALNALAQNRRTLFWLTFDGRLLQD